MKRHGRGARTEKFIDSHVVALGDGTYYCKLADHGVVRPKATWFTEDEAEGQAEYLHGRGYPAARAEARAGRNTAVSPAPSPDTPETATGEYVLKFADGTYYATNSPWRGVDRIRATRGRHAEVQVLAGKLRALRYAVTVEPVS